MNYCDRSRISALLLGLLLHLSHGFYLPGVAPTEYTRDQEIDVKAVKMTSIKTQIPYEYYSLKFCRPAAGVHYRSENLGEVLRGDRISNTPYILKVLERVSCRAVCAPIKFSAEDLGLFAKRVEQEYSVHMLLDNLPAATKFVRFDKPGVVQYEHGFKLGNMQKKEASLHNHLGFVIKYHEGSIMGHFRIVGFEVQPFSVDRRHVKYEEGKPCLFLQKNMKEIGPQLLNGKSGGEILFSYSVVWEASEVKWASRWDTYLSMSDGQIHWFAIVNSLTIVLFLSGIVAIILVRTLRRDIARYNQMDEEDPDDAVEETGWKLVHGDVFRPPQNTHLLCATVGSGIQILCMVIITLVLACLGMLSPASRGALMSSAVFLYAFMGLFAGYFSGRIYRTLKGQDWIRCSILTASLFPAVVAGICFLLNFFLWAKQSSAAVPFTTMLALLFLWAGVSLPLVSAGFYFGFRKQPYDHPVRTNQIPRQVPDQVWYMQPAVSVLLAGILPFCAVFIELFFILTAIWENQFYYLFGFLFLVFIILVLVCSEITVVLVYFMLCGENYHWWWRSVFLSSGSAMYVFLYSVYYFVSKLEVEGFVPTLLYFGYTLLLCFTYWLFTSSIGFFACYWFVRNIYGAVKID